MKFIHTADWHLGKLLKEHSMTEDQAWLLENRFLPLVDEEKPDVILLSGDVYDRSYPPEEAVELFDRMTEEIVGKRKIPFIIISGNHDSAERLAEPAPLPAGTLYLRAPYVGEAGDPGRRVRKGGFPAASLCGAGPGAGHDECTGNPGGRRSPFF